jgi:ATP synthase protein I
MVDENEAKRRRSRQLLEVSTLGFMFPAAIGIGYLCGYGLDHVFGTWPWLTAIFTGFGVIAAFINLFRMSSGGDDTSGKQGGGGESA